MVLSCHPVAPGRSLIPYEVEMFDPGLHFSTAWDLLGPFQTGTREASWGADPLEYHGGFRSLHYDPKTAYPSSLGSMGQVHWMSHQASIVHEQLQAVEIALTVSFPEVDWHSLQRVYGWAALQYQAWARGQLIIEGDEAQTILLYTDSVLEFWVDDAPHFGGDYYAYRRAPLVLHLQPGAHTIDLRIVRDVRVMGGIDSSLSIRLKAERSPGGLVFMEKKLLVSDVVNGTLSSPYASLPVRNDGKVSFEIRNLESASENCVACLLERSSPLTLAPGQARPVPFRLHFVDMSCPELLLRFTYATSGTSTHVFTVLISHLLSFHDLHAPQKVTFRHQSGIVSYAILRAPSKKVMTDVHPRQQLPIHLNLHGAGLEADSHQVRHMLDQLPDLRAFVLFPTGVTPWSGDDWHDWGFADVKAAIASVPDWILQVGWQGPQVDSKKWFVSGHSNGGQGTLYALTHYPDSIIGAAPLSGYLSIQKYVPYQNWIEADSRVTHVVQSSLQSFRHELLVENFKCIPVLQQHGSNDENVPTFHSRRLYQLTSQSGQNQSCNYIELKGKGHWYDGVMTTPPLRAFYARCLAGEARRADLPRYFQVVVANPADMGSRGGLQVDQLVTPDQLGKVNVTWDTTSRSLHLDTSNIRRFHFVTGSPFFRESSKLVVDGQTLEELRQVKSNLSVQESVSWLLSEDGVWKVLKDSQWMLHERYGSQLGPLLSILRTRGCFHIQYLAPGASDAALQISRNLYQYFGADSEIIAGPSHQTIESGNVITLALGTDKLPSPCPSHPIEISRDSGVVIRKRNSKKKIYAFQDGLGIIFLRPLSTQRLELVVWGNDDTGFRQASRLVPLLTGVGQPDFIIVRRCMAWEGAAGALAMGSFDSSWQISEASLFH